MWGGVFRWWHVLWRDLRGEKKPRYDLDVFHTGGVLLIGIQRGGLRNLKRKGIMLNLEVEDAYVVLVKSQHVGDSNNNSVSVSNVNYVWSVPSYLYVGTSSNCSGDQGEHSDIVRSNGRQ